MRAGSRGGDRDALQIAIADMRTLAHSPRYWDSYLALLRNPLARLVDLLVIKQGDRIADLRRWRAPKPDTAEGAKPPKRRAREAPTRPRPARTTGVPQQPSLFDPV